MGSWRPPPYELSVPPPCWLALPSLKEVCQREFWKHFGLWMLVHSLNLMKFFFHFECENLFFSENSTFGSGFHPPLEVE